MSKGGRPSSFKPEFVEQAYKLALLGMTDQEVASFFEVADQTIYRWKSDHPEFSEALKAGKDQADSQVASKLFRRAMGYSHETVKIMQYQGAPVVVPYVEKFPPDVTAAIFWLKNRQRGKWRDRYEQQISGSPDELTKDQRDAIVKAAARADD